MSANVLVVEYEPRYIDRIRKALSSSGYKLEVAGDVDAAVSVCAAYEPQLVVITSVLPRVKIEDAITQLRARAGLPTTPFLILMSGYRGEDPTKDAVRYGAQDILERPFAGELLIQRVERLLSKVVSPAATQAIPQDMLDALRRSAGLNQGGAGAMTSDELFGDILSDVEDDSQITDVPVTPTKAATEPSKSTPASRSSVVSGGIDDALAGMLDGDKAAPPIRRATPTTETDVDMILSQTLAGLDIQPVRRKAKKAAPPTEPNKATMPKAASEAPKAQDTKKPTKTVPPAEEAKSSPPQTKDKPKDKPSSPAKKSPAPPASDKAAPPSIASPVQDEPKEQTSPAVDEGKSKTGSDDKTSGTQFGQYILKDHIATGGMAEVYQARMMGMEGFQKTVAIKRILPHLTDNDEFVTMFIDEAKLAAQLNHNNIIHIYDLGKIDRSYYIAMEYIDGRDLRSILQECRDRDEIIPTSLALYITTLLGSALDYAHKKRDFENRDLGLVHRDVSPQNVLISNDGLIKLCDFGIAKAASKASHTRAGALKGKLQYMSPEQAWGKDIDHRSDIFSLGVVLYEMLTCTKVFAGDSELSILEQVRRPKIPNPSELNPEIPEDVAEIAMKALEADRDQRYQSARDLQHDIDRVMRRKGWAPGASAVATFVKELTSGEEISGHLGQQPGDDTGTDAAHAEQAVADNELKDNKKKSRKAKKKGKVTPKAKEKTENAPSVVMPDPEPVVVAEKMTTAPPEDKETRSKTLLYAAIAALVVVVVGLGYFFSRGGSESPPKPTPTPVAVVALEPTATPTEVDDMEARIEAELARQEQEMRQRVEKEYPTPTPIPPTATPTETPVPTEVPTATPTAKPTATPRPRATAVPTAIPPTPTPSVREGDIVVRGPGVTSPVIVHQVDPQYPKVALRMRANGEVEVEILVGIDGSVEDINITSVSRTGMGFEKSTSDAISQWRYKPATKNGVKVRMWVPYRVPFRAR